MELPWLLLSLNSTILNNFTFQIEKLVQVKQFTSVLILYENYSEFSKISVPKIIININKFPLRIENYKMLMIISIESLQLLDKVSDFVQKSLDTYLFLISQKLSPNEIFSKCFDLDLPNVVLFANGKLFLYCYKSPIEFFETSFNYILEKSWIDTYNDFNCSWVLELSSRRNKLGQYKDLHLHFTDRINAIINITTPLTRSQKPYLLAQLYGLNESHYSKIRYLEFLSVILISPIHSNKLNKNALYLTPFDRPTWAVIVFSIFYIAIIIGIISKYRTFNILMFTKNIL